MKHDNDSCRAFGPCGPWGQHAHRPAPRHWFFARIFLVFMVALVIGLCLTLAVYRETFSFQQLRHFVGWTFLLLLVCFFILRRLFRPMRRLLQGVQEISNGNLEFQFETGSHGEFRYLADAFNLMVRRVREMLQSKSQLLLDVSHELRSPLTRMKLALEMMPKSRLKVSMTQDIQEMETMLTEILESEQLRSRNGQLQRARMDLGALVHELAGKYKTRRPGVRGPETAQDIFINADEARVRTVLQNVVENALKYSAQQRKPVQLGIEEDSTQVVLSVRDFGIGIPAAEQEKIFEPFYRVDKSRTKKTGGYGLGLSLCWEIMRAHGGEIALHSEIGKGTTIVLTFPK